MPETASGPSFLCPRTTRLGLPTGKPELEESLHELGSVFRNIGRAGFRALLDPLRQAHRVTLRRVVHAKVIADLSDHDLA